MLDIKETEVDGVVTFALTGTFDLYFAPELDELFELRYKDGKKKFIIDIGGLELIDSSGLGILLKLHSFLEEREGRLCVIGGVGSVARIFQLTNLDQRMIVLKDHDQAMRVMDKL